MKWMVAGTGFLLMYFALVALAYGYRALGSTYFLVSSGLGFWGSAICIGSRSELWSVKMTFGPAE